MKSRILFALACTLPLAACIDSSPTDELENNDATAGDASKADAPGGTFTYYFVQADLRKCASPMCGGVFYRLANATQTRCFDGTKADKCYAASSDLAGLGLGDTSLAKVTDALAQGELLMRATVGYKTWTGIGQFAKVNAKEAWLAQGPNPVAGPLMKIEDSGVRCITYPCPSYRERKLNSAITMDIAGLEWDQSGASDRLIGTALDKMHTDGLIVSGYRTTVTGPAGDAKARSVTQLFLKVTDEAAPTTP